MLLRARRRTVGEQVEALGVALDAGGDVVEGLGELRRIGAQEGVGAADVLELARVDFLANADDVERRLFALRLVEGLVEVLLEYAPCAIGAVGEHDERAKLERRR